jgi:hypothetical protein
MIILSAVLREFGYLYFLAYFLADLPVQVYDFGIHGFEYTIFGGFNQG